MLTGSRKAPRTAGGSAANLDPGIKSRSHSFCFAPRSHTQYHSIKVHKHRREHSPRAHSLHMQQARVHLHRPAMHPNQRSLPIQVIVCFILLYAPIHCKEHTHTAPAHARSHATAPSTSASTSTSSTGSENLPCECMCAATQPYFLNADRLSLRALHSDLVTSFSFLQQVPRTSAKMPAGSSSTGTAL